MTKKELLVKIYNEMLERLTRCEIDEQFFIAKSANFKKKSPDYISAIKELEQQKTQIFWNSMLVKTIKKMIDNNGKS